MTSTGLLYAANIYSGGGISMAAKSRPTSQEERILAALNKPGGALPHVSTTWLTRYFDYLSANLIFPFAASCPEDRGSLRPWTADVVVVGLAPPSDLTEVDDTGLMCEAMHQGEPVEVPLIDLEVATEHVNAQPIEDYWYWFWNWRFDPGI
jgi:hypothetical protein